MTSYLRRDQRVIRPVNLKKYLFLAGLAGGSKTEMSSSVERLLSKAFLWSFGEIHAEILRICFPYVLKNTDFAGSMTELCRVGRDNVPDF